MSPHIYTEYNGILATCQWWKLRVETASTQTGPFKKRLQMPKFRHLQCSGFFSSEVKGSTKDFKSFQQFLLTATVAKCTQLVVVRDIHQSTISYIARQRLRRAVSFTVQKLLQMPKFRHLQCSGFFSSEVAVVQTNVGPPATGPGANGLKHSNGTHISQQEGLHVCSSICPQFRSALYFPLNFSLITLLENPRKPVHLLISMPEVTCPEYSPSACMSADAGPGRVGVSLGTEPEISSQISQSDSDSHGDLSESNLP
eukprot:g3002.t1